MCDQAQNGVAAIQDQRFPHHLLLFAGRRLQEEFRLTARLQSLPKDLCPRASQDQMIAENVDPAATPMEAQIEARVLQQHALLMEAQTGSPQLSQSLFPSRLGAPVV